MEHKTYAERVEDAVKNDRLDLARELIEKRKVNYQKARKETEERMQYYEDSGSGSMGVAMGFFCGNSEFEDIPKAEKDLEDRLVDIEIQEMEKDLISLPEVQSGKGVIQNEFHDYDVYDHTLKVAEILRSGELKEMILSGKVRDKDLVAAAYLHDIGKPVVAKPRAYDGILQYDEQGRQRHTFGDHEKVGEEMVREMDSGFFEEHGINQEKTARLVGAHYAPMTWLKKLRKTEDFEEFYKTYKSFTDELESTGLAKETLELFCADTLGKGDSMEDENEVVSFFRAADATINRGVSPMNWLGVVYRNQYLGWKKEDKRYAIKK